MNQNKIKELKIIENKKYNYYLLFALQIISKNDYKRRNDRCIFCFLVSYFIQLTVLHENFEGRVFFVNFPGTTFNNSNTSAAQKFVKLKQVVQNQTNKKLMLLCVVVDKNN